ncbi:glutamate synthase central domain-containing protein [Staphylococcus aureus]
MPYLAQRTVEQLTLTEGLQGTVVDNVKTYTDVSQKLLIKTNDQFKIGQSKSYQGAQIFEAISSHDVIDRYFSGTQSKLSGISIDQIDAENKAREQSDDNYLASGGIIE